VRGGIEPVGEQLHDAGPAEFPRRQADMMDDEENDRAARGAFVAIGRRHIANAFDDPFLRDAQSYRQGISYASCKPWRLGS